MSIYTPYTYLIGWSKHNKWYYGVRFGRGCHPSDLWVTYFTSSKRVKKFWEENGDPDVVEVRKTFQTGEPARIWEEKVLHRIDISDDKWLNANVAGAIDPSKAVATKLRNGSTNKGKTFPNRKPYSLETLDKFKGPKSEEHKQKLRVPKTEEHKQKLSGPRPNARGPRGPNKKKRDPWSEEVKQKIASARKAYWERKRNET